MLRYDRPPTPEFLREAAFTLFGEACLHCGVDRPLEIAHIRNWPTCQTSTWSEIEGMEPPSGWVYAVALARFHNIANVVPLCPNCHTLYDQERYSDVTVRDIHALRAEAVKRREILDRMIDFVGVELSGCLNRCEHADGDGKRSHTRQIDAAAALMPLRWISAGYGAGTLTENPHMIVIIDEHAHHHVHLDHGYLDLCLGEIEDCGAGARVWKRRKA